MSLLLLLKGTIANCISEFDLKLGFFKWLEDNALWDCVNIATTVTQIKKKSKLDKIGVVSTAALLYEVLG